ncbi:hypothetical protein D869_gp256 [Caulobacter phage CcrRogue]|uniref:Uncharacterized protein n=1 Tax=Caulobacter phage CcrRogue TaxID=2927986 RepID=K4JSD7_9CAUD|nr:hypothetical protein D869_gp256 [Caulobacter phage CcrRogue]AFU86658.1 hypothetical protein CcrRogue_gp176 [Caulobacter phage CcrRogue]
MEVLDQIIGRCGADDAAIRFLAESQIEAIEGVLTDDEGRGQKS